MSELVKIEPNIFGTHGNGTLDFYLSKELKYRENLLENLNNDWNNFIVRRLNIGISRDGFNTIYIDSLNAAKVKKIKRLKGNVDSEKIRNLFQQTFPKYELLGRYYDDYEDYFFNPEEVKNLYDECLEIRPIISNELADLTLRKLIYSCNEALKNELCLIFICD